ncbi:hypothetical protein [Geodermatophilus sp. SYSU D00700]
MGVDWGDVPTWAASVLTPLSVYAALTTLKRERSKYEADQARLVHCELYQGRRLKVTITNDSTRPISNVWVLAFPYELRTFRREPVWGDATFGGRPAEKLMSGEAVSQELDRPTASYEILVWYVDADHRFWTQSLRRPKLHRGRYPKNL